MTMFMFCVSYSQSGPSILFHDLSPFFLANVAQQVVPLMELFTLPEPFKGKIEHIVITQ